MQSGEDHTELIEKYQSGEMSVDESKEFEKRLTNDEQFKISYEHYLDTLAALKTYHFKKGISEIHREYHNKETTPNNIRVYVFGIAAAILLLVVSIYFYPIDKASNAKLLENYFEPYPSLMKVRGGEDVMSKALDSYSEEKYDLAIPLFYEVIRNSEKPEKANLYMAVSYMAIKDFENAKRILKSIPETSLYSEQLNWYLALAYIASDDIKEATIYLQRISSTEYKYSKAKELLKVLDLQ